MNVDHFKALEVEKPEQRMLGGVRVEETDNPVGDCPQGSITGRTCNIDADKAGFTSDRQIIQALADLKERQLAGEHMPCPRCGEGTMKEPVYTNALSRRADIYVCDRCGLCEALDAFVGKPKSLEEWAFFRAK